VASAERGAADWTFVVPAVVAQRSDNSPFNFESFLGRAGDTVEDVFVAGFNLHYVATTQQCEDLAMAFLRKTPRRVIRILLSDPAKASQFRVWERVGDTYLTDLTKAVARFKEWRKRAKREGVLDRLEIKQTTFVPHSLTAIDPESAEAVLALTPAVLKKPLSAERPQLVLSRRHQPAVFSYYWDSYKDLFRRGSPLALKYGDKVSTASRPPRRP
jgi:hypothetical protein